MQSSVASDAPRLAKPPSLSNDSVHISREVSVTSSHAPTPPRRASYSTMPPIRNGRTRTKGGSDAGSATGTPYRRNSKTSARSPIQSARGSMQSTQRPLTAEYEVLNNNRESMKALSDFLMTREPPPNHFMSTNLSDDDIKLGPFKRSANKILGRKKKKKEKPQQLLQLPDSAVAAKTSSGARHIAISIPIEHDHLQNQAVQHLPPARQLPQRAGDRSERGAVTVLKPVAEVRESASSYLFRPRSKDGINELATGMPPHLPRVVTTPPTEVMGQDNTRTLQNYYFQLNQDRRISTADTASTSKPDPNRKQRSYIAVSPVEMSQQEADPRHSGGTTYSTTSIVTGQPGHSRGPSTGSTAQSMTVISSLKLDLPPRHSSIARIPRYQNMEHIIHPLMQNPIMQLPTRAREEQVKRTDSSPKPSTEHAQGHNRVSSALSGQTGIESVTTVTSFSHSTGSTPSPPTVYISETARKYSNADGGLGPQVVRSTTPRAFSGGNPVPRPRTAPPQSGNVPLSHFNDTRKMITHTTSQQEENIADAAQGRRDRVRAMKKRDMSVSRPKSSGDALQEILKHNQEDPIREVDTTTPIIGAISRSTKSPNCRRNSQELARKRNANSLSGILLVASLTPCPSPPLIPKQSPTPTPSVATAYFNPSRSLSRSRSNGKRASNSNLDRDRTSTVNTPPRSYTSSISANSETDNFRSSHVAHMRQSTQSLRSTLLETRRQERRAKRNVSLREKELDDRLLKIERDNMILLKTLNGIASSFGELKRLSGQADKRHRRGWMGVREVDEERRLAELERMEPIMRDLQGMAPRVSTESVRQRWEGEDEFDEDDGGSILFGPFA